MKTNAIQRRALLQGLAACAALSAIPLAQAAPGATIRISDDSPQHRIRPGLFGANLQWEHSGDGAWDGGAFRPGLVDAIKSAGIGMLRFPGGELANRYQWKSGIGPVAARPPGLDYAWQNEPSIFGSDEFIALCRQTGATPVITVNPYADPVDAADWVEYVNGAANTPWGSRRVANGQGDPLRAVWWEFGNETFNPYTPGFAGAADYARRYLACRRAMRARDPSIKLGLVLESSFQTAAWMRFVLPHMVSWNDEVLAIAGRDADFAVLHFYAPFDRLPDLGATGRIAQAGSEAIVANLAAVRAALARNGRAGMPLLLSEYGLNFADTQYPSPRIAGTDSGLMVAALLARVMAAPDIVGAQTWSLINNSVWGALASDASGLHRRPQFDALALAAEMAGMRWLPANVSGPVFSVPAIGNIPGSDAVPALVACAARAENGRMKLLLVNRVGADPVATLLSTTSGWRRATCRVWSAGDPRLAPSGLPNWSRVGSQAVVRGSGGKSWSLVVPPVSIAMVDFSNED